MKESLIILNMTSVYRSGNGYFVNPSVGESLRDISERFEKVTLVALNSKDNRSHCDKIDIENIEVKVLTA